MLVVSQTQQFKTPKGRTFEHTIHFEGVTRVQRMSHGRVKVVYRIASGRERHQFLRQPGVRVYEK